jgi:hypothetical protein
MSPNSTNQISPEEKKMSRTIEAISKGKGATSDEKSASATPQTMKAIRIHRYGGPEALQYENARARSQKRAKFSSAFRRRE